MTHWPATSTDVPDEGAIASRIDMSDARPMTDPNLDALVNKLVSLTDEDRLNLARWALSEHHQPATPPEWGGTYVAEFAAEDEAARAFGLIRNDGTVPDSAWDFMFDPCFPDSGWRGREAADGVVRAMARALAQGNEKSLADLSTAFDRLDLPPNDQHRK